MTKANISIIPGEHDTSVYRNVSFPFLLEKQGKGDATSPLKWALLVENEYMVLLNSRRSMYKAL